MLPGLFNTALNHILKAFSVFSHLLLWMLSWVYGIRFSVAFRNFSFFKIFSLWFSVVFDIILSAESSVFYFLMYHFWVGIFFKTTNQEVLTFPRSNVLRHPECEAFSFYLIFISYNNYTSQCATLCAKWLHTLLML